MAVAKIDNKIKLSRTSASEEVTSYLERVQTFTMKKSKKGENLPLIDYSDGVKSIAKVTQDSGKNLFLQLDDAVVAALPEEIKSEIKFASTNILEINTLEDGTSPIELDEQSNELRMSIKAKDGNTSYTCVINALGVQLQYGKHKSTYFSQNEDESPKVLHPTMSTDCFEEILFNDNGNIKLKGKTSEEMLTNPNKIPSFMIGTYFQAININLDKIKSDEKLAEAEIEAKSIYKPNDNCEIFTATVPDARSNTGFTSYYFFKTIDSDTKKETIRAFHQGTFADATNSITITRGNHSNEEKGSLDKNVYLVVNRTRGKPLDVKLPRDNADYTTSEKYREMLYGFADFTQLNFNETLDATAKSGEISLANDSEKFPLVSYEYSRIQTAKAKTKVKEKSLVANLEEEEERRDPPPPPPEPNKTSEIPFVTTPKKVVNADKINAKPDWGINMMLVGIVLMLIAMPFAPAIAAILAGVGLTVTVAGAAFALNADRLANPYLKWEKYIVDTLSKHERELENQQEAFWENNKDLSKAQNNYNDRLNKLENDENPSVQYLKNIFGDEYASFISEGGFDSRNKFIEDLNELMANKSLSENQKTEFITKYWGPEGPYGKAGINLTAAEINSLKNKVFENEALLEETIRQVSELNGLQEKKNNLEKKQDKTLQNSSDEVIEKIIRKNLYSQEGMTSFVENNAASLARYLVGQDFSQTKFEELTKNLTPEALEALEVAMSQISEAQTDVENAANEFSKCETAINHLNNYVETITNTRNAMVNAANGETNFVSESEIASTVKNFYAALELDKTNNHARTLDLVSSSEHHEILDRLKSSLSKQTIEDVAGHMRKRDKLLEDAGFFNDIAREYIENPEYRKVMESLPFTTQISSRIQQILLEEYKTDPITCAKIKNKNPDEVMVDIASGKIALKGSKAVQLHNALLEDQKAKIQISSQLDFSTLSNEMNKIEGSDKTFVTDEEVSNATQNALTNYPNLKNYTSEQQKSIIKLALIMDTKRRNLETTTGDEDIAKSFEEDNAGNLNAINYILDGTFGVVIQDEYLRKAYGHATELSKAKKTLLQKAVEYGDITAPLYSKLSKSQQAAIMAQNPTNLVEFEKAVRSIVGNETLPDLPEGTTFEEYLNIDKNNISFIEGKYNGATVLTAEAKKKVAILEKGYKINVDRIVNKSKTILGEEQTQSIYTETKLRAEGKHLTEEELHPALYENADDESKKTNKTAEKYNDEKKRTDFIKKQSLLILKEYTEIMGSDLPNDAKKRRLEILQTKIGEISNDIDKTGLKEKTLLNISKMFTLPNLPTASEMNDPNFKWEKYDELVMKHLSEIKNKNGQAITANEFLLFGDKKPKKSITAKATRKNTNAIKTKLKAKLDKLKAAEKVVEENSPVSPTNEGEATGRETDSEADA